MKRLLALMMMLAASACAQTHQFPATDTNNAFTGSNTFTKLNIYSISGSPNPVLPTVGIVPGTFAVVNDGMTSADCTVGSGTQVSACIWTGSAWTSFGGGGGGGGIVPGTSGNVIKYASSTTGGDSGVPITKVAIKANANDGQTFGSANGTSSDGLSTGTAEPTVISAFNILPTQGGTVNLLGTSSGAGTIPLGNACQSLFLVGSGDSHFNTNSGCYWNSKSMVMNGLSGSEGVQTAWTPSGTVIAASGAPGVPAILINGYSQTLSNIVLEHPYVGIELGGDSNGTGCTTATANLNLFNIKVEDHLDSALFGPGLNISCNVLWGHVANSYFAGNPSALVSSDNRAGVLMNAGIGNGASGLITLENITTAGGGGLRMYGNGNGDSSVVIRNVVEEGYTHCQPTVEILPTSVITADIQDVNISDCGINPATVKIKSIDTPPNTYSVHEIVGANVMAVTGPARIWDIQTLGDRSIVQESDGIPEPYVSPAAMNEKGVGQDNVILDDVSDDWRKAVPSIVRIVNDVPWSSGSWVKVTGTIAFAPVADPWGGTTATQITCTAGPCKTALLQSAITYAPGDYDGFSIIAQNGTEGTNVSTMGMYYPSSAPAGGTRFISGNGVYQVGSSASIFAKLDPQDDGRYQRLWGVQQVTGTGGSSGAWFEIDQATGATLNIVAPMHVHAAASALTVGGSACTATASPAGQIATNSAYGPGANVAVVASGACPVAPGQPVIITGSTNSAYNTTNNADKQGTIETVADSTHFTYWINGTSLASSGGGTITPVANSEAAEYYHTLGQYPSTCTVGQTCGINGAALTSASFSALTSGTNTAAAMVLGTGSSLTVSGSGTNNATTLGGATFAIPGTIGGTTPAAVNATQLNLPEGSSASGVSAKAIFYGLSSIHWPAFNPNNGGERSVCGSTGTLTSGHIVAVNTTGTLCDLVDGGTGTGSGTVTNVAVNTITTGTQNFATAAVSSPGVSPVITQTLVNAPAHKTFMNNTAGSAAPDYESIGAGDLPATTVNSVVNGTNVTGSISGQALTLGWTGALAANLGGTSFTSYTKGDTICPSAATTLTKLGVGTNGQVLTAASGATCGINWANPTSAITLQTNGVNNSSQTTLNIENSVVSGASAINCTNPSAGNVQCTVANITGTGNAIPAVTVTGPQVGDYLSYTSGTLIANVTPGVVVNAQTGTSYSVSCTAGTGDRGSMITFNNAAAIAVTVPSAASCPAGFYFNYRVIGAGAVTFTPTTSTVNGSSTLLALGGQFGNFVSDNTNYQANRAGYASGTTGSIGGAIVGVGCDTGTVTINGAATTMVPVAGASTSGAPGAGLTVSAQVTSANTVTVSVCAPLTLTPTTSTYFVRLQE